MQDDQIRIRPAQPSDAVEIWRLLHNDQRPWNLERVRREIDEMYVLTHRERLLGVLHGSFAGRRGDLDWVSVHPMYPEDSLRAAMVGGLYGVLCRQPLSEVPGGTVSSSGNNRASSIGAIKSLIDKPGEPLLEYK
ncbi:MAG: hypothetical protein HPY50_08360 [Firmicutes bacterium]|nr:hypothetical protein [Bacillota bacterium]